MNEVVSNAGAKTSEFRLVLLFVLVVLLDGTPWVAVPETYVTMLASLTLGYGAGRTWLKQTIVKQPQE